MGSWTRAQGVAQDNSLSLQRFYLLLEELAERSGNSIAPEQFQGLR